MSTVAIATTHPALVLRNAVDAITTELVRANVAPASISVSPSTHFDVSVNLLLRSRGDFDSAATLFNLDLVGEYEDGDRLRVTGSGRFMGMFVSAGAPAADETIPADCDAASLS